MPVCTAILAAEKASLRSGEDRLRRARIGEQAAHRIVELQVLIDLDPPPAGAVIMTAQHGLAVGRDEECLRGAHGSSSPVRTGSPKCSWSPSRAPSPGVRARVP